MMLDDPALPAAPVLLDREAATALLQPAVQAGGGRLLELTPHHARYQRGRRLAVRYGAKVTWAAGNTTTETYAALIDTEGFPPEVAVLHDDAGTAVGVWAYPHDPFLPGLPAAASPASVRALLAELGATDGPVRITPRVYRPTARAVLSILGTGGACYLKVLPPGRAAPLHTLHDTLHRLLPVPASYGFSASQGIVVLEALRGEPLSASLTRHVRLPSPEELLGLLDRVADAPSSADAPSTPSTPSERFADYAATLGRVLPSEAMRAAAIADAADDGWSPDRTVHGDFYEAQVLVDDGRVTGLLDVDSLRRGDNADDLATLLAHLEVLAWVRPASAVRIRTYLDAVAEVATGRVAPDRLARRVAGTLLGLAAWPFRAQRANWPDETADLLGVAESWLPPRPSSAVRGYERTLMPLSSSPQMEGQQWVATDERKGQRR